DGIIRFEVDNVSSLNIDGRNSPEVQVKGVPWYANVYKTADQLGCFLYCSLDQSKQWSIDVDAEFILIHSDSSKNIIVKNFANLSDEDDCDGECLLDWPSLMDKEKGFIKDDKLTVEVRFWVYSMRGIRAVPVIDFTDANEPCHDVALVINGEKIYVSKQVLGVHSPVFKAMFFGDFAENNKKEIELKDVDRVEFIDLLHVIYSSGKIISDSSSKYLLKLGD
ncbi:hypothetical protein PMAYCL1PPCAC_24888, partial [Pristionchus mayeri]